MSGQSQRFLIAGAGYLGLRAADNWQKQQHIVHAITRSSERAAGFRAADLIPIRLNLSDPPHQVTLPEVDCVLWAVGFDRTKGVSRERIWIDGLQWLLTHLPAAPSRFIYVSSTSVYGAGDGGTVDEDTPTNPATEGGEFCIRAEQLLRGMCQKLFPQTQVVVLRLAGIYGPDRLLRRVKDLKNGTPLTGDASSWLNLIHVEDAVRMVDHVAAAVDVPNLVNVVNSRTPTRHDYYSRLAQLVDAPPPVFGSGSNSSRARGGNKKVTSRYCGTQHAPRFAFDDVLKGLEHAVKNSADLSTNC